MNKFYFRPFHFSFSRGFPIRFILWFSLMLCTPAALYAQVPSISYSSNSLRFTAGQAITTLKPNSLNVSAFGYAAAPNQIFNGVSSTLGPLATDNQGNIYTLFLGVLKKIPPAGAPEVDLLNFPNASRTITTDAAGNVYIADFTDQASITRISPAGIATVVASGLNYPGSLAIDQNGNIYFTEIGGTVAIKKLKPDGSIVTVTTNVPNLGPMTIDRWGNLYADGLSRTGENVYKIPASISTYPVPLAAMPVVSTGHASISGLSVDNAGNLYVAQYNNIIYRVINGVKIQISTVIRPTAGGLALDPNGNVLVSTQGRPLGIMQTPLTGGYYISPALPEGLKFDMTSGAISGIPVAGAPAVNYTVTAYNSSGSSAITVLNIGVQSKHYVKQAGAGSKNGSSWANASDDLQLMINNALAGDEIWVAGGIYIPNRRADNTAGITPKDRDNAFVLKADVKIFGGFAGVENSLNQRDLNNPANKSTLSGDFSQDDVLSGTAAALNIANNAENAYHVVVGAGSLGTAQLDGFTIVGGNANTAIGSVIRVNNTTVARNQGGGIGNFSSSPQLSNLVLTANNSRGPGGGIININFSSPLMSNITIDRNMASPSLATSSGGGMACINNSSPVLNQVVISNNTSFGGGGAYIDQGSSPVFTNVIIRGNYTKGTAFPAGGGIYNADNTVPVFTNVLIADNYAQENGGGMYNYGNAAPILTNVTMVRNMAAGLGGGMYSDGIARPKIRNSIIWDNNSSIVTDQSASANVNYSLVQGGYAGTGNINVNPVFADVTQGDYTLKAGSPAIDVGSSVYFDTGQVPDLSAIGIELNGNARKLGAGIDMGAYEFKQLSSTAALNFDGTDDKVVFPAAATTVSGSFTVMAWVRPTDALKNMHILSTRQNGGYGFDLELKSGNTVHASIGNQSGWLSTTADAAFNYSPGRWMHVAYAVTPAGYQVYVNGELSGSGTFSGSPVPLFFDSNHPLQIGNNGNDNTFFKGDMDELRIYNTALTQANIQADMLNIKISQPASLMARYSFDDGQPLAGNAGLLTLTDQSGKGYNGTLTGFTLTGASSNWVESYAMTVPVAGGATDLSATGFTANWSVPVVGVVDNGYVLELANDLNFNSMIPGSPFTSTLNSKNISGLSSGHTYYYRIRADKLSVTGQGAYSKTTAITIGAAPGSALNFDGIDDYVSVAAQNKIISGSFTVMAWVRPTHATKTMHIFSTRESADQSFDMQLVGGNKIHADIGSGGSWITTNADASYNYPVNRWTHIAYSVSASGYKIYANGIEVGSGTFSGTALLMDASRYITLGKNANENTYFQGDMDEVRVYDRSFSAADIQSDMLSPVPASANLVSHYNFDQAGSNVLTDQGGFAYNGTLNNFSLSGQSSNWVESYAMVLPAITAASAVSSGSFTAGWSAPAIGIADNYIIDVASDDAFTAKVTGSPFTVQGTAVKISGLSPNTTYYYRIRADKTSLSGQGTYTATAKVLTVFPNADLSALLLSDGTLAPLFSASVLNYTVSVAYATSSVTVTPTAVNPAAVIQVIVNGDSPVFVSSGNTSAPLALNVGDNTVLIKVTDEDGVTVKEYSLTITRTKGDQLISFATLVHKTYGDPDFNLTATGGASGNPVTYQSSNLSVATINGNVVTMVGAGTTTITASQAGNAGYLAAADVTQSLIVDKGTATIALSNLNQIYDGTAKSATAVTNPAGLSGIALTYDGSATLPTAAGTYVVVASLTNSNYTAPDATGTLVIGKGSATIALSNLNQIYDGTAKSATAVTNPAGLTNLSITYNGSATLPTAAGTYVVVASLTNSNYTAPDATGTLVIGKATAAIALSNLNQIYDGTAKSATAVTNPAGLTNLSVTYNGSATLPTAAGTYVVVASLTNSNYTAPDATGTLIIKSKAITVTADVKTKNYGDADPLLTYTISTALVPGDYFTGSLSRVPGENPGTYAIVQGSLSLSDNYVLNYQGANLSITGGQLDFAALPAKTYGDVDFRPAVTSSNSSTAINFSSDNPAIAAIVNGQVRILGAGTVNITASQAGAASISRQLNIAKAGLTIIANSQSRLYGAANPVFTLLYNGFVNGDDVSKLSARAIATTTATVSSPAGNYPISPGGALSANYSFNYVNGILTILPLSNADVINLAIKPGILSPVFDPAKHNYTASVNNNIDRILLTITLSDINARVLVNGGTSRDLGLNMGNNTIVVEITAQDGKTKNTYTLSIYRGMSAGSITATNILTPNNDGKNDRWVIQDIDLYPNNNVKVFDRAGRIVYTKQGYHNEWDGALNGTGEALAEGTYYFIVDLGTGENPFKGFITIIRNR